MKRLVLFTALLFSILNAYPQGDVIFDNFGGGLVTYGSCPVPASLGIVVQLYASSTSSGTFSPIPNSIADVGVPADGYFDAGVVRIPASIIGAGAAAFMEVRAWEEAYGATYEEAAAASNMGGRPARRGISNRFSLNATGNPQSSPPGTPIPLSDLIPGFSSGGAEPCPEPSTWALGLLGVGTLALLHFRKRV